MNTQAYNLHTEDILIGFEEEEEQQEIKGGESRWALRRTTDRLQAPRRIRLISIVPSRLQWHLQVFMREWGAEV